MRRLLAVLPVIREVPGVGDLVQHGFEHPVAHSVFVQVRPDTLARPGVRLQLFEREDLLAHVASGDGRGSRGHAQHGLRAAHVVAEQAKGDEAPKVLHLLGHGVEEHEKAHKALQRGEARLVEHLHIALSIHHVTHTRVFRTPVGLAHPRAHIRLLDGMDGHQSTHGWRGVVHSVRVGDVVEHLPCRSMRLSLQLRHLAHECG